MPNISIFEYIRSNTTFLLYIRGSRSTVAAHWTAGQHVERSISCLGHICCFIPKFISLVQVVQCPVYPYNTESLPKTAFYMFLLYVTVFSPTHGLLNVYNHFKIGMPLWGDCMDHIREMYDPDPYHIPVRR